MPNEDPRREYSSETVAGKKTVQKRQVRKICCEICSVVRRLVGRGGDRCVGSSYQDLEGKWGSAIYYRAPRYRPRALFGGERERFLLGSLEARLCDISLTGAAFFAEPPNPALELGSVAPMKLWIGDTLAFAGTAKVVRREDSSTKVAVRFVDSVFDAHQFSRLREALRFRRAVSLGTRAYIAVPEAYARAVSNVALFLRHWKSLLDKREEAIRRESDTESPDALNEMEQVAGERMREEWRGVRARAIETMPERDAPQDVLNASKCYTETLVTPLLMEAPIWNRAYTKPLGYPGDYVLMNYMYDETPEGNSAYGRILHRLGREERLAATVPARKAFLVRLIGEKIGGARSSKTGKVRVASLGSGPAREIDDFLASSIVRNHVEFTLIDQDESALQSAQERLVRAALRHRDAIKIRCRNVSFRELFANRGLLSDLADQDLVYSAGFFDYLPEQIARELLSALLRLLRPGGHLAIGNAADDQEVIWVPEFVLDWHMIYRTEEDMRSLADLPSDGSSFGVERDSSKSWHFLMVRRND